METGHGKTITVAALMLCLLVLTSINLVRAVGLHARTDELVCGDTKVQAFTTCAEDSKPEDIAVCTDQYFFFTSTKTGKPVRTNGPGKTRGPLQSTKWKNRNAL